MKMQVLVIMRSGSIIRSQKANVTEAEFAEWVEFFDRPFREINKLILEEGRKVHHINPRLVESVTVLRVR